MISAAALTCAASFVADPICIYSVAMAQLPFGSARFVVQAC
ncbi:MAG TPA: hypothetical protein VKG05_02675 [Steroidobacteraceae bacterium]|nr:hypothetical protein [Steroidobacteraceae bacterium]